MRAVSNPSTIMRLVILAMLALGTAGVAPAEACKCARSAPCAEYWRVSAVFAGTVREIRPVPARPGMLAIHFDVDQRGRGVNSDAVVVEAAPQTGDNCGYTFAMGRRYVVYADRAAGGTLTTSMCHGNKPASAAATDLAFLKEVTGPPRGVRVFGHVRRVEYDLVSFDQRDYGGVASARVQVVGDRVSRETTTGPDGDYDFRDLPAGTYNVTVTPPKGLALAGPPLPPDDHHHPPPWSVTLTNPSECAEVWTWPLTDAHVSGVLLDSNGRPARDSGSASRPWFARNALIAAATCCQTAIPFAVGAVSGSFDTYSAYLPSRSARCKGSKPTSTPCAAAAIAAAGAMSAGPRAKRLDHLLQVSSSFRKVICRHLRLCRR